MTSPAEWPIAELIRSNSTARFESTDGADTAFLVLDTNQGEFVLVLAAVGAKELMPSLRASLEDGLVR